MKEEPWDELEKTNFVKNNPDQESHGDWEELKQKFFHQLLRNKQSKNIGGFS